MNMKYRKKPVVVEAVQWTGKFDRNMSLFVGDKATIKGTREPFEMKIHTLEGDMTASVGDFIIKGVNGEFYHCKPDIFKKTYEVAEKIIENPKIKIESNGEFAVLHLNGEHVRGELLDLSFHADVNTGIINIKCDGIIQKKDENGQAIVDYKNRRILKEKFHYDSQESNEIQFEDVT